jgi:hypothetical protein
MIEVRWRHELRGKLQQTMKGLDVVLTATQPSEAVKIDAVPKWDLFDKPGFTMPFMLLAIRRSRSVPALVRVDYR